MDFALHVLVAGLIFVAIDAVWLSIVANKFYKAQLKHLLAPKPNMIPAAIFYVLYMIGLVFFAVDPALEADDIKVALGHGALLGITMYATYDLTNHATIKDWPAKITYVDLAWGTTITSTVAVLSFIIFS